MPDLTMLETLETSELGFDDLTWHSPDISRMFAELNSLSAEQRFVIRRYECDARGPQKSGVLATTGSTILVPEPAPSARR